MDFEWVAIALGDVAWIGAAFACGLAVRAIGLPPLVGFLAAGFMLNVTGMDAGELLQKLADLGITLLLFTVGLKLDLRSLMRPQIWAVTGMHTLATVVVFGLLVYGLAVAGLGQFAGLALQQALLIAFALSFSSTVFVVKMLEDRGEMASLHGRLAIGVLIMQDLLAVAFLAITIGKWPSWYALSLLLLVPLRPVILWILARVGHSELLVLFGLLMALGGAEVFELVGLKGDLGALIAGVLIARHVKSEELAKTMLSFKDLFLVGFFLSVGQAGELSWEVVGLAVAFIPLILFKSALFFGLFLMFRLRARTALFSTISLSNFSEFGLIVAALSVSLGWLDNSWLIAIAIAVALSFVASSLLAASMDHLYAHHRDLWKRWQKPQRLADDRNLDFGDATVAVIGMGGIGSGCYDSLAERPEASVVGMDLDENTVRRHLQAGRRVIHGDPSDADFWDRLGSGSRLEMVLLALPNRKTNLAVIERLTEAGFTGRIAATARFDDEAEALREAGAGIVYNTFAEAGAGFANHALRLQEENGQIVGSADLKGA